MTFHDQVHGEMETAAFHGARNILIWIKTIGPENPLLAHMLLELAAEMKWDTFDDPIIGKIIR